MTEQKLQLVSADSSYERFFLQKANRETMMF